MRLEKIEHANLQEKSYIGVRNLRLIQTMVITLEEGGK